MAHFVATNSNVMAEGMADLYLKIIFKSHEQLEYIISDRSSQFVSKFMQWLLELMEAKGNRSMAYYLRSDRQTEKMNQIIKQYLWALLQLWSG